MARFGSDLAARVREAMRAAALTTFGAILGLVGAGCLLAALWVLIALHLGAIIAFTAVGMLSMALSWLFLLVGQRRVGGVTECELSGASDPGRCASFVRLAEGFAIGVEAGRAARAAGQ